MPTASASAPRPAYGVIWGARQDEAGEALVGDDTRYALAHHQATLAEEVARLHRPHVDHLAAGILQETIGGPVEDQVQRISRVTRLDDAGARGKPLHAHVVPGQPHSG